MKRIRRHGLCLLLMVMLCAELDALKAQKTAGNDEIIPDTFPKNYTLLQVNVDQPEGKSKTTLLAGDKSVGAAYSYYLARRLIIGVNFKNRLLKKRSGGPLALMTFGNHTQGIFRLYHPLYLLLGSEWSYIIPTKSLQPPFEKDPSYSTEIGVALSASIWYFLHPRWLTEIKVQRWKGTKTSRLDGLETSFAVGLGF